MADIPKPDPGPPQWGPLTFTTPGSAPPAPPPAAGTVTTTAAALLKSAALTHSPGMRNAIHLLLFFFAGLPLMFMRYCFVEWKWFPDFDYYVAALFAFTALINAFILKYIPGFGKWLRRPDEQPYNGLWTYPLTLAVCFAVFPSIPAVRSNDGSTYAAFGAWAVLACGDAMASFVGRHFPHHKLPWNSKKTYAGLLAFFCCAAFGAYLSLYFFPCPFLRSVDAVWTLSILAAAVGAVVESFDWKVDDNVSVPFASGATIVVTAYFLLYSTVGLPLNTHVRPENFIHAIIANAVLGALVLLFKFADLSATLLGIGLGIVIFFYAGWQGYLLVALFVAVGSIVTRIGMKTKLARNVAEGSAGKAAGADAAAPGAQTGGAIVIYSPPPAQKPETPQKPEKLHQRGIVNVAANLAVAAICCILYPLFHGRATFMMAFAGALCAALADTASAEIGVLASKQPRLITNFRPVPHGTNGAISLLGMCSAFVASALMAWAAWQSGFIQIAANSVTSIRGDLELGWPLILGACGAIVLAGMFGTTIDSLMGATIEGKFKWTGKGFVNIFCTLAGAIVAGGAAEIWVRVH